MLEEVLKDAKQLTGAQGSALVVYVTMEAAHYLMLSGDLAGTKRAIEECAETAESLAGVDPIILASYYRVCADYYKVVANLVGSWVDSFTVCDFLFRVLSSRITVFGRCKARGHSSFGSPTASA